MVGPVGPSLSRYARALGRCAIGLPDLVAAIAPVGWPRTVERAALSVGLAEERGARLTAAAHRDRLAVLGHADVPCTTVPAPTGVVVASQAVAVRLRRTRALAALADVSAEVDRGLEVLVGTVPGGRPRSPAVLGRAAVVVASAAPVRVPHAALAVAARRLTDSAPPLPAVTTSPHIRPNLLTEVVLEALPSALASAPVRHVVGRLRHPVVVGLRVGEVGCTISLGRDAIRVRNGVRRRTHVTVEEGIAPLLRRASGRLEAELAALESR